MKKVCLLLLALMLTAGFACAEEADVSEICTYTLMEESELSVELAANVTTGYEWDFEVSEDGYVEAMSQTYIADEAQDGMIGVGGTYIAKFGSAMDKAGAFTITFVYRQPWDLEQEPVETVVFDMWMTEAGTMSVENVTRTTLPFANEA